MSLLTTIFLISSFISHSLFHFFFKMSLAHTCRCSHIPYLWVVTDLLDSSFFHFLLKCWVELHTAIKTLGGTSTLLLLFTLYCVLYHPVQHVNRQHKAIFIFLHLLFLWSSCWFHCLLLQQQSSFHEQQKHTQTLFPKQHHFFQGGPVLQVVKEGRTKWFLKSLLIPMNHNNREKVLVVVGCP